jgi:hypothetical protein
MSGFLRRRLDTSASRFNYLPRPLRTAFFLSASGRNSICIFLLLVIPMFSLNNNVIAQATSPISVHWGVQNWTAEMREISETTQDRGLIVWISVNNTDETLPARITSGKLVLALSPHTSPQSISLEFRDILVPPRNSFVWYFSIMPAVTLHGYGELIPKPEPGEYVLKVTYALDFVEWFDSNGEIHLQSGPSGEQTLDPLKFVVVTSEQKLQDDIQQYKQERYWTFAPNLANPFVSELVVIVIGGVIVGVILYVLFYRKQKAPVVTIREVQRGGIVVQNINVGRDTDPESSKRITEGIPDQLFVGEPRAHTEPIREPYYGNIRDLIQKVAHSALGSDPLTPIIGDALEIARTLKRDEESRWLKRELYGYEERPTDQPKTFPDYRRVTTKVPIRVSGITKWGETLSRDFDIERTLFVSLPVNRIEDTVSGARSRGALELVFWMNTPKEFSEMAREQNAQIASENAGKTPFIVQINDLERLLSELRLRIHKFVTACEDQEQ